MTASGNVQAMNDTERLASRWRRFQAITLALDGLSSSEIAVITGMSRANVMQVCHRVGISIAVRAPKQGALDAAVMAVAAGAVAIDAAAAHGVSPGYLYRIAADRGVNSDHTSKGRRTGRIARAVARVLADGVAPAQAAALERTAPHAVHAALRRRKDRR